MRYNVLAPRLGLLWDSDRLIAGMAATYNFRHHIGLMQKREEPDPFNLIFHVSPILSGNQNGLLSKPYQLIPELVLLISNRKIITRAGLRREQPRRNLAAFIQNNFTDDLLDITGLYGIKFHNYYINLMIGGTYSTSAKSIHPFGELSFGIIIPYEQYKEEYPWAPAERNY